MILPTLARTIFRERTWSWLNDVLIFAAGLALLYGLLAIARTWLAPITPAAQISRSPFSLPAYAAYSLARIGIAYVLSLSFALVYGYIAAYSPAAERIMLPLLDILQSIPVLSFLPGVMLAMVAVFPGSQVGVELGSILLIFTGEIWNIAFSFYASLKELPRDLQDVAHIYRFSAWQRFRQLELPYAMIGLVWNSMMSVAGGWFFLMACEMFVLGDRDFRLPGLGSYLQVAASASDMPAILWGVGAMIGVIVLLDQLVWRPVLAWADKFKFEQVESGSTPRSAVLNMLRRSAMLAYIRQKIITPVSDWLIQPLARHAAEAVEHQPSRCRAWARWVLWGLVLATVSYAVIRAGVLLSGLTGAALGEIAHGAGATFLRVHAALLLGAAWTIPAGVKIGLSPRLARVAQPLVQIAASMPATALFPVMLLVLMRVGGGLNIAAVLLMLLGTQWYILFNVIAGAMALPTDLREAAHAFRFNTIERWRLLILPGIFPYLVTGLLTAAGGAWNASIIAEYFHFKGQILLTTGLGASISQASDAGDFPGLLAATLVMAAIVVAMNRLVWRKLYKVAETRFKLEA